MKCYVVDFGAKRLAVCEENYADDRGHPMTVVAQDEIAVGSEPTPETWAKLGAVLVKSGEILEAQ